ncbi:MAG: hypothetical protein ABWY25_02180 [Paenisporosarcina sp.]
MIMDEDSYLEHFGTKGMKWGQRRAAKKAAKKEAMAKADKAYGDAVANLVAKSAKKGTLISMQVNNRTTVMTGKEAAEMLLKNNGQIPRNATWNELVPIR